MVECCIISGHGAPESDLRGERGFAGKMGVNRLKTAAKTTATLIANFLND